MLDDLSTGHRDNLKDSNARVFEGSVLDVSLLREAMTGADAVVHLAALGSVPRSIGAPLATHEANATGTLMVLEAARKERASQVVIASSSSVYGSNPGLPRKESDWTNPISPYAVSKLASEAYGISYNLSFGMRNIALRFFNVFGPRQRADNPYAAVVPSFVSNALRGLPLTVHGDGNQSRDFTYVGSVCSALHRAVERNLTSNRPINLAFGSKTTIIGLARKIEDALDAPVEIVHADRRPGDVNESQADPTAFRSMFGSLEPETLDVGIMNTIDWFRNAN